MLNDKSNEELIALAKEQNLSPEVIAALKCSQGLDGKLLVESAQAIEKVKSTDTNKFGFELDMNGQTILFYLKWAIEHKIPGYQLWMLKRAWCWSTAWNDMKDEGWTFDQVQRGVIGSHFEDGYVEEITEAVRNWLARQGESPGEGPALEKEETTGSVCYRIVKPATEPSKLTYRQAFLSDDVSKKATHFVSHSWSYPFWAVLESLINHQLGYDRSWVYTDSMGDIIRRLEAVENPNYYWFDLFNKNQHIVTSDSTALELTEGIQQPGKMVFVLHPIKQWSVKRIWCLFEVLICMQVKAKLEVAFSFSMLDVFERQQVNDGEEVKAIPWDSFDRYSRELPDVDVENADATYLPDKAMILDQIRASVGIEEMNRTVRERLTACFKESAKGLTSGYYKADHSRIVPNTEGDFNVLIDERDFN